MAKKGRFWIFWFQLSKEVGGIFTLNYWNGRKRIQTHGKKWFDLLEIGLGALDCLRLVCVLICIFFYIFGKMLNVQKIRNILKEKIFYALLKKRFM